MLHRSFKPAKCKTALKLSVSRIKLLNNKREVQIKQIKRELAQLLESGQIQTARIRVEHVFREEKTLTAYNLIEIYCELIAARLPIIESQKNCPIDLKEAITSVIFATPRCSSDVPELADIKKHLTAKYGKDFVSGAIEMRPDCGVNRMLVEKLSAKAPDGPTKLKILTAIAEEHNVKWNPELFSDSDPKSSQDLLNGPNTFEMASKIHTEAPPPVQARPNHRDDRAPPNTQVPQRPNENFNEPNTRQSSGYQNFPSTGVRPNNTTTSSSFHSEERSSGIGHEKMEPKQSYPRNENSSSSSGQDWTMGFKDATSAAQAAAESAERASMAARAAAELSQRSAESPRSHGYSPKDEQPKSYGYSPKDEPPKSHGYSPKDEPPKSYGYSSKDEPPKSYGYSPKDEPPKSYGYSPKAESPLNYASSNAPENNSFHGRNLGTRDEHIVRDEYSQKRSPRSHENEEFFEKVTKKNQDHMKKQSSNVSRRSHSHSSSFGDSQEKVPRRNSETTYFEETKPPSRVSSRSHSSGSDEIHEDIFRNKDPFARGDIDSKENTALFDDYGSDNDHHEVDLLADSTVWSPKRNTDEKLTKSTSPFHPSVFSQAAEVSSPPTRPDDSPPAAFDDYDSPSSGSDEEPGKSGLQKLPSGKNVRASGDSDRRSQGIKSVPVPEKKFESTVHVTEEEEDLYDFSKDSELLNETSSESGNKLKFGALTGGLRNKGITRPPYTKKPSFRAKEETENTRSDIGKSSSSSSRSSTVRPSVDPRAGDEETHDERSSSRQSKKASMRSFVGRGDYSDDDDNIDELLQQDTKINRPSFNRRPVVEPNRKPSPKAKLSASDSDSSDSEEDVAPKSKSPINARPGLRFSRRTKASSPMKTTVLSEETGGRSHSKPNRSDGAEPKSSSTGQAFSKMTVSPSYVAEPKSSSRTSDVNETLPKASGRSYSKPNPRDEAEPKSSLTGQAFSKIPVSPSHVPEPKTSSRSSDVNEALPKTSGRSYSKPNPSDRAEPKSSLTGQAFSKTTVSPSYVAEPKSSSRNSHVDEDLPRTTKGTDSGFDTGRAYSKINVHLREPVVTPGYRPESKSSSSTSYAGEALSKPRTKPESSDQPRFVKQDSPKPNPESGRSPRVDSSKSSPKSTKSDASEASKVMSRENSSKDNASHVHPKLPDSDSFTAFFHSLRQNRE